jgi:hypothetical protein
MELPKLTQEEQNALMSALGNTFGPCTCRTITGHPVLCDGHLFIAETQAFGTDRQLIDRVTRLLYARREAHRLLAEEFGRPFTLAPGPMPEPEPSLPPDLLGPPREPASPQSGDEPGTTLPW